MKANAAQVNFLRWVAAVDPKLYHEKVSTLRPPEGLGELGWINFVVQAAVAVGSAVAAKRKKKKAEKAAKKAAALQAKEDAAAAAEAQRLQLIQINAQRAQAGMMPVNSGGQLINTAILPMPPELRTYGTSIRASAPAVNYTPFLIAGGALALVIVLRNR